MKHLTLERSLAALLGMAVAAVLNAQPNHAKTRPITDFVVAQGTYCFPDGGGGCLKFVPPAGNFFAWGSLKSNLGASVDYAGLVNACAGGAFGTAFAGTVVERPLNDGRAEVNVILQTKNALTWAIQGDPPGNFDWANGTVLFGNRWNTPSSCSVTNPVLGDSFLQVVLINTAPGAPLPDLMQLVVAPLEGQELRFMGFRAAVDGTLRAAYGVPDGTPGRLTVVQTGIFMASGKGATADGYPAERVELRAVGK